MAHHCERLRNGSEQFFEEATMGILDRLFGPAKKGSSGLFNQANGQWQVLKDALLRDDDARAQAALLEVVRLCQEAIAADPQKEGNAYVLLTNALLRGGQVYQNANEELLTKYAAACIYSWWTLPHKGWPITSKNNYEIGTRWYQEAVERLGGSATAESTMAQYGGLYGELITSPAGFEDVRTALKNDSPDVVTHEVDVETLTETVKNAVAGLTLAPSPVEFGDQARKVHGLAKVIADALVEEINALGEASPLTQLGAAALSELVFAMSQADVYAFKSNPFMSAGAPANVQASWLNVVKAAVHDEARALARALEALRKLHGLESLYDP